MVKHILSKTDSNRRSSDGIDYSDVIYSDDRYKGYKWKLSASGKYSKDISLNL